MHGGAVDQDVGRAAVKSLSNDSLLQWTEHGDLCKVMSNKLSLLHEQEIMLGILLHLLTMQLDRDQSCTRQLGDSINGHGSLMIQEIIVVGN